MKIYLLRTIRKDKKGNLLVDNLRKCKGIKEVVEKVWKIDPDDYEVFEAEDITNEIFIEVERIREEEDKNKRKKLYETLKKEFEKG